MNTPPEATVYRSTALVATAVVASDGPSRLFGWTLTNSAGAIRYVKVYDKATAATEADTPVFTIGVPTLQTVSLYISGGVNFSDGISIRCVTGAADNNTTAATSGDVLAQFLHKKP